MGQNNEKGKIYILPGHVRIKNNLNDAGLGCFDNLSTHLMAVFKARCQKETNLYLFNNERLLQIVKRLKQKQQDKADPKPA